jgi:hypothetical protein
MIQLNETLAYDESKTFDEQTEEVQAHINEQMKTKSERTTNTYCGRTESEKWNKTTYEVVRNYNYLAPESAKNCFALKNTVITVNSL